MLAAAEPGSPREPLPIAAVIPAFNRPDKTVRAVQSALAQRPRPPAEVLVIDDHSSDDTGARAELAGATVIRREENGGESEARNTGVAATDQPWIAFLDSDDRWASGHLAALWPHTNDHVLVGASAWVARSGEATGRMWGVPEPVELDSPAAIAVPANLIVASGTLVRRDALLEAGGFAPGMKLCADLDAWLRVLEHGPGLMLPDLGVLYEVHDAQASDDREAMRRAHRDVVGSYSGKPWATTTLIAELDGSHAWDDLHEVVSRRDYRALPGVGKRVLGGVDRMRGAARMRRHRRLHRRINKRLVPPPQA